MPLIGIKHKRSLVLVKGGLRKRLGEDVGDLLFRGEDLLDIDDLHLDSIPDPEVTMLDVLQLQCVTRVF